MNGANNPAPGQAVANTFQGPYGAAANVPATQGWAAVPGAAPANGLPGVTQAGVAPTTAAGLIAPATALAGTATTITANGAVNQPIRGGVANAPAPVAQPGATLTPSAAGLPLRDVAKAAPQTVAALANPRAQAAAVAGQAPAPVAVAPTAPAQASLRAGAAQQASTIQAAAAQNPGAQAGAAARGVPGGAQAAALALAQAAMAQALGRIAAGQMTAGGAALALAEAQLALRAGRLAQAQGGPMPMAGGAAVQRGMAGTVPAHGQAVLQDPAATRRAAANGATGLPGAPAGRAAAQGLPAQSQPRAGELTQGALKVGAREAGQKQAELGAAATMPQKLATALAMAPKLRQRGSHDRVEKIDKFTPRAQTPEMEDEDFWDDGADDEDALDQAAPEDTQASESAAAAVQHYRALQLWLQANEQQALLRELALGRRVMVLAPPDLTHLRLVGHVLWPDAAGAVHAAGASGRAWPLAARWMATLPADMNWQQWRLRQWVDAEGEWHVAASQPNRHTPRLLLAGDPKAASLPSVGEYITVTEPRRLHRLMGQQWTMMALRVPVPLDGMGAQGTTAGAR